MCRSETDFTDSICATVLCNFTLCNAEDKDNNRQGDTNARKSGTWFASHQFKEHGVFYVAVYLCTGDDYKNCTVTNNKDSSLPSFSTSNPWINDKQGKNARRVPSTWGGVDSALPNTTFTICPQGTKPERESVVAPGAQLGQCLAKSGWYSPYGPGHVAEFCKEGFNCEMPGTEWPVAMPGYWVGSTLPLQMGKCLSEGACPGSKDLDSKTCSTDGSNQYTGNLRTGSNTCFDKSAICTKGRCVLAKACYDQIGHRCCPGAKGKTCATCCTVDDRTGSCSFPPGKQWMPSGGSGQTRCEPCRPTKFTPKTVVFLCAGTLTIVPFVIKARQFSKHAGAVTGPILSVLNFVQSAELFQGIQLNWPNFFRRLAKWFFRLFNFDFDAILRFMDFPSPECAFRLTYLQKWFLIMASPLLLLTVVLLVTVVYVTIWKCLGLRKLWAAVRCSQRCASNTSTASSAQQPLLQDETDAAGWHYRIWADQDGGSWQAFDHDHQVQLSAALASEESVITLTISGIEYCVDVDALEMRNTHTGRRRKIQRPWQGPARACVAHNWESSVRSASRLVLVYLVRCPFRLPPTPKFVAVIFYATSVLVATLRECNGLGQMVGYIFLAGKAMEPLACHLQLDGTKYIGKQPDIECNWCSTSSVSGTAHVTYRTLATCSIVMTTIYGLGTPILFGIILFSRKDTLQTNEFTQNYGFLSTKMKIEFFWWEIFISVRKLGVTLGTKFSDGVALPCALINVSILLGALIAQVWKQPFANTDANIAEALTLIATIFTLILGVAQPEHDADADLSRMAGNGTVTDDAKGLLLFVNRSIYVLMFVLVGVSVLIVARRLVGAWYNLKNLQKLEEAAADGRQVPDEIREMLDSRWILLATAWAAIKANENIQDELPKPGDRVVIQTDGTVGFLQQLNEQTGLCAVEVVGKEVVQAQITDVTGEGDIERMLRVFKSARDFRNREEIQRWETILQDWETFFPMADRRIMHIWGPLASVADIEDMVWFMRQLHAIEVEQHRVALPRCCSRRAVSSRQTNAFLSPGSDATQNGRGALGLSLRVGTESESAELELQERASKSLSQGRTKSQRLTMVADRIRSDRELRGGSCRGCQKAAYQTFLSSGIRATGTCVWALISFCLTLTCIIRWVAAGDAESNLSLREFLYVPNDVVGQNISGDDSSNSGWTDESSASDSEQACIYRDSGWFWILLMLAYWVIVAIATCGCMSRLCKGRYLHGGVSKRRCCRFCCCCCGYCCTRACAGRIERRRRLTTFDACGIDSIRFGDSASWTSPPPNENAAPELQPELEVEPEPDDVATTRCEPEPELELGLS
jgi:hypothetical protein